MPVMIRWFADGVDPDYGLLAFRRISERLGGTPWFLRMLRDSSGAAESLTRVLSSSRYVGELMEWIPESAAWLDDPELLRPRSGVALQEEARAIQIAPRHDRRRDAIGAGAPPPRAPAHRDVRRSSAPSTIEEVAKALTTVTEVTIQATLRAVRREIVPPEDAALDFSVIAMGRFGGSELGFGSDADVMYVYRPNGVDPQRAHELSLQLVAGAAQALRGSPRAARPRRRPAARGPQRPGRAVARRLRRVLPPLVAVVGGAGAAAGARRRRQRQAHPRLHGARRRRAVPGDPSIRRDCARSSGSRRASRTSGCRRAPTRRVTSSSGPGRSATSSGSCSCCSSSTPTASPACARPRRIGGAAGGAGRRARPGVRARTGSPQAWRLASRLRSANTLLSGQTSDVLPTDRKQLDGIGRLLGYPPRSATQVEEDYLGTTRRARRVFEQPLLRLSRSSRPTHGARGPRATGGTPSRAAGVRRRSTARTRTGAGEPRWA